MSGITSVKSFRKDPSRTGPVIWAIVGIIAIANRGNGIWAGLIILAATVLFWVGQKPECSVILTTASGEVKALASSDSKFIENVVGALNQSIVHRG